MYVFSELGLSRAEMEMLDITATSVLFVECIEWLQTCLKSLFQGTKSSFAEKVIEKLQKAKKLPN